MRRRTSFVLAVSIATAVVLLSWSPAVAGSVDPVPIPGGIQIPDGPLIHTFAPGPEDLGFQGVNIEPNTITNFEGFSALAYIAGTATDADGNSYVMQTDMRVFRGTYVAEDGSVQHGTFAFI
jgi:hypothetical protein